MKYQARRQSHRARRVNRMNHGSRRLMLENMEDRRMLAVIMATDFDDSTIGAATNIKTNLNWTLNGVDDPGDIAAFNAAGAPQAIFDSNGFVQDIFIPGLNTGNGNTFWTTTDLPITVAAGSNVTLEDVTFNSVSVSGGQAENVNRRNDYTVSLLDPSGATVEEITVADITAGTAAGQPLVTFDFVDVALSDPGSYTLRIQGGDFVGANETGNHTGLDNLSVNGTITSTSSFVAVDDDYTASNPTDEDTVLNLPAPGVLSNDVGVGLTGELGVLDLFANGGINPQTGNPWEDGDQYRLAFVTSGTTQATSTDITTYNDFVQNAANAAGLGAASWTVVASTETVNVRTNTGTTGNGGETIFLTDGSTVVANDYGDLWDGSIDNGINLDENGDLRDLVTIFTGTENNGTTVADRWLGTTTISNGSLRVETGRSGETARAWTRVFNASPTSSQSLYALSEVLTVASAGDAMITAFDATSANGAAVALNADGSFSYDPTGSATLQALDDGQAVTDTFTYTLSDDGGITTDAATVSVRVTGISDFAAMDDSYDVSLTAGAFAPFVVGNGPTDLLANDASLQPLTVASIESTQSGGPEPIAGNATILTDQGASVTVNDDGSFSYDASGSAAIQALDNSSLTDSFEYTMTDGTNSSTAVVSIEITVLSPAGPGDVSVFTVATASEPLTTSDLVHDFDTEVRISQSHALEANGSDITLSGGHHLVIYNSRFDSTAGANRTEVQSNLNINGNDLPVGWSQGYIRRQNGQDQTITAGGAIIDAADGDILQLQSFRTDNNPGDTAVRADGASGIQLIKLDDAWDYARLSLAADQAGPADATFVPVTYDTQDELDAGSFTHTAGSADITLNAQGKYLVFANTFLNESQERSALIQRLTLDGTTVPGSTTTVYIRGNQNSSSDGAASIGMILETSAANQVLNVEGALDVDRASTYIGGRTGVTIVKLPDDADYIRLEDTSGDQDLNVNPAVALNYDDATSQLEVDAAFTHSTATDSSRVGVNASGDYLFLSSQYDADDGVQRGFYNQGWQVNGAGGIASYGQTGRYSRNTGGADEFGNWSGFVTGLQAGDYVETLSVELGNTGTNTADVLALQGVNLDSLFVAAVDAIDDDYTVSNPVSESGTLDTTAAGAASILANDTPNNATILGINGTTMLTGTSAEGATVTVNADGSFVYDTNGMFEDLADGASQPDSFTYTIDDGMGNTDTATVALAVAGENDNPVSQDVSTTATEDGPGVDGSFDANDIDSDDDPSSLTYSVTSTPAEGSVVNNNDGTFTFNPGNDFQDLAAGATRVVTFDYTATDSNNGVSNTSTVDVTVTGVNDSPTVAVDNATATADEGQTATNSGTFADIDVGSSVAISASAGTVTQDDTLGTWSWSFVSDDGPSESQTITITADDGQGGVATTTFDLAVINVAPTASITGPTDGQINTPVSFTFDATDPSTADETAGFTFNVDWGDGTIETIPPADSTHTYTAAGQYTITVSATDKDGDQGADITHVIDISADPVALVGDDIVVTGTSASDRIIFLPSGGGFRVRFNNQFFPLDGSSYSVNAGTQLIVNANEGSDYVIVHGTIGAPAVFDGGDGNDYLSGGTDGDTLVGGPGNDVLLGGEGDNQLDGGVGNDRAEGRDGSDLIFGGAGNDRLNGGGGNDIIDGGSDNDLIFGGLGDDLLSGREGSDTLNGHYGNDIIYGGSGVDQLFGGADNDLLFGGTGNDRLRGDSGDDTLIGGTSALEADTEASLDNLLATGALLPSVQAALDAWFASQSDTSRMLYEPFGDDGSPDELTGSAGVDTFQTGSNDRLRDAGSGDIVLP